MEMMNEAKGLKIIINSDDGRHQEEEMRGKTLKEYWKENKAIIESAYDVFQGNFNWISSESEVPKNKSNP